MITGKCVVKPEYRDHEWPVVFAAVPRIGDFVYSLDGFELMVKKVVHSARHTVKSYKPSIEPIILVHLGRK
jgi:hypothetical protein